MLPVTLIPFVPTAFRMSAPWSWFWIRLRNHVLSQSFGIDSVLALVIPGLEISALMLPLAVLDLRGQVDREDWGRVRDPELHHQAVVLPEVPPDRAVVRVPGQPERLRVVPGDVEGLPPVVREQEADPWGNARDRASARG